MRLSLSIEDTNRLRAKVGLRLIRDGEDTLVEAGSTPSERVQQLQARMVAAEERAEERALHAAAAEGPTLTSSSRESTTSWLDKMRQKRDASTTIAEPAAQPVAIESTTPPPIDDASERRSSVERFTPLADPEVSERSQLDRSAYHKASSQVNKSKDQDIGALDPLEAPAEPSRELKRQAHLDYDGKTAVFRPKKLKSSSKTRVRSAEPFLEPPPKANSERDLENVLFTTRVKTTQPAHTNLEELVAGDEPVSKPIESDPEPKEPLVLGPTHSFLRELRQSKENVSADTVAEHAPPVFKPRGVQKEVDHNSSDADSVGDDEVVTDTVVTNSIADTLRALQSDAKIVPSSKQLSQSRREWTKKLKSTQMAKQAELASSLEAAKNLPPNERQKVYEMHKKEIAAQDAKAAKELFQSYTPDVNFDRRDEHGNIIDSRKAFKLLSSAFHGNKVQSTKTRGR